MAQSLQSSTSVTRALQAAVQRSGIPAVVALIVSPGAELYREAFGEANVAAHTPLTADAIFRVFSMTKPVTSVAAMMLVEEKKIALDDPIAKYLSGRDAMQAVISMDDLGHFVSSPPSTPVTIRHLLTHTSGIAYAFTSEVVRRVQESAPSIPDTSLLVFEPGERWVYGPGTKLLGDIVASVSGQGLDAFFQERIFGPLKMVDTAFTVPEAKRARLVTSHQRAGETLTEQPLPETPAVTIRGDSGLYSTAADYGRFLRLFLNGGELEGARLLSAASVQQMGSNQIGALTVDRAAIDPALSGHGRDGFGFGFQIAKPAKAEPNRPSAGSLSWSGAMNTFFWIDPARRVGAVLLTQVLPFADPAIVRLVQDFEAAVYGNLKS